MVCKIRPDDDDHHDTTYLSIYRPSISSSARAKPSAPLRRLFAVGALRFEMDKGRSETQVFQDSYAKWLETILEATIMRNQEVEQGVKDLRTKNGELRRRCEAMKTTPCMCEDYKEEENSSDGDDAAHGNGSKQEEHC